jgi:hypothetical protein
MAAGAPLEDLYTLLLRQLKRPLLTYGIPLSDADAAHIAAEIVQRAPLTDQSQAVRDGLIEVVAESERVLANWNLTFEQSLETGMDAMPGWESTAEFLDIANDKSNAEIRIAAASALVTALGDLRYAPHLLTLAAGDPDEMDTAVAERTLALVSGLDVSARGGLTQVRDWLDQQG